MKREAILFFFGCSEVNSTWLITSELVNELARKALFTCVVYTIWAYSNLVRRRPACCVSSGIHKLVLPSGTGLLPFMPVLKRIYFRCKLTGSWEDILMSDLCNWDARWSSGRLVAWLAGCSSYAKCSVRGGEGWGNFNEKKSSKLLLYPKKVYHNKKEEHTGLRKLYIFTVLTPKINEFMLIRILGFHVTSSFSKSKKYQSLWSSSFIICKTL